MSATIASMVRVGKFRPRSRLRAAFLPTVFLALSMLIPTGLSGQESFAGGWVRFVLAGRAFAPGWGASSVLDSDNVLRASRYGAEKALDRDPATAWVEGARGAGIGESYYLGVEDFPEALGFINGYARNNNLFHRNHRVKELRVHIYAGLMVDGYATEIADFFDSRPLIEPVTIRLEDTREAQRVELPVSLSLVQSRMEVFRSSLDVRRWRFPQAKEMGLDGSENLPLHFRYILKLEIVDIYPGSTWEDTCIAEIWPDYGVGTDVSVSPDMRSLLITQDTGKPVATYADINYVITLLETSSNREWALVLLEPAYLEVGERATSSYTVIHTPTGWDVGSQLFGSGTQLGTDILPLGFISEGGRTYVEYENMSADKNPGTLGRVHCTFY
ncbi:MAG: hypothetical protein LC641_07335 [Spirochaeta sp.]|nr:hypothetical protein [Spirochaeta sp.]